MGIVKAGRVVIILAGRFAGRKAVVVRAKDKTEEGNESFGYAVVAGVDRYPRKIVKAMGSKKVEKRSKIKPFVKIINLNHLMPTRHTVDFDLKKTLESDCLAADKKVDTRKTLKKLFEEKFKDPSGKSEKKVMGAKYLFTKLNF